MWRRVYLLLLAVRLYFALVPSYIHPDEHFQGPEVIAGDIFSWRTHKTWEFTSSAPIRSFFPLWLVYGMPMRMLDWIIPGHEPPKPIVTFYFLRVLFFLLSFVLEDWAVQELVLNPRQRRLSILLLASSYVTWTYQTHTFSNSIETLAVLWSLVLIGRISESRSPALIGSAVLGFVSIFGLFNRITFPAFLLFPACRLIPHFLQYPSSAVALTFSVILTAIVAISLDTLFYTPTTPLHLLSFSVRPIVTPLNNILYNTSTSNLAEHGLHPRYTHLLMNLPQLLGPAFISLLLNPSRRLLASLPVLSTLSALVALSALPHQEARFLIPCVPLLLTTVSLPMGALPKNFWIAGWILFNSLYGVLLGLYHQAGIVPAQTYLSTTNATDIVYWKAYNPPTWLLGPANDRANTTNLMGASISKLMDTLSASADCGEAEKESYLAAPLSATKLDTIVDNPTVPFWLERVWSVTRHVNMDDLDFAEDGVIETVKRVVGRRGFGIWRVRKRLCDGKEGDMLKDW